MVILLCQRIHPVPYRQNWIILTCSVIEGIQSVHHIKLLSIILKRLELRIYCGLGIRVWRTEGIIVGYLINLSHIIHNLTDIAKVILEIVMIASSSQAFSIGEGVVKRHIPSINKQHALAVLIYDIGTIVCGLGLFKANIPPKSLTP